MIQLIRSLDVAWVAVICFVFSFIVSRLVDRFTPPLDKSKPKWRIFIEVTIQFAIIGIIVYGARLGIKHIPFGLDGTAGYTHSKLGELRSLPLLVFIFMFFQKKTQAKMNYLAGEI